MSCQKSCSCYYNYCQLFHFFLVFSAPPAILNQDHIQEIVHGETSLLRCDIDKGIPEALVEWLIYQENTTVYDFPPIRNGTDPRYRVLESGLEIANVQLSDARVYRCYVYNDHGTVFFDIQAAFVGEFQISIVLVFTIIYLLYLCHYTTTFGKITMCVHTLFLCSQVYVGAQTVC